MIRCIDDIADAIRKSASFLLAACPLLTMASVWLRKHQEEICRVRRSEKAKSTLPTDCYSKRTRKKNFLDVCGHKHIDTGNKHRAGILVLLLRQYYFFRFDAEVWCSFSLRLTRSDWRDPIGTIKGEHLSHLARARGVLTKKPECHSRTCTGVKPERLDSSVTSASVNALPRLARVSVLPIAFLRSLSNSKKQPTWQI